MVNDAPSVLAACLGGHGIAQPLELYSREALRSKRLIRVLRAASSGVRVWACRPSMATLGHWNKGGTMDKEYLFRDQGRFFL